MEAVFRRSDTPQGVQFDVTPAPAPAGAGTFLTVGGGCLGLWVGLVLGGVAALATFIVSGMIVGEKLGFLLCVIVGAGVVVWRIKRATGQLRSLNPQFKPARLTVSPAGVAYTGGFVSADDIVELVLRHPNDAGGYSAPTALRARDGVAAGAYNAGARVGTALMNRSFALMARRKSISTPEILAQGLTWNAGEALLHDVREAMK